MKRLSSISFFILILFADFGWAKDFGISIERAQLLRQGNEYRLEADIDYRFSDAALNALDNGVSLTLRGLVKVKRSRRYMWDETIEKMELLYRLRYRALSDRYQIVNETSGVRRYYASMESAIEALGKIRGMPVLRVERLASGESHYATMQIQLDIEALPLPLRPIAYLSPAWYLSSSKYTWLLAQ
ncbi:MAG: DUF4390 domain-containing protein [Methylococcales bacterium]